MAFVVALACIHKQIICIFHSCLYFPGDFAILGTRMHSYAYGIRGCTCVRTHTCICICHSCLYVPGGFYCNGSHTHTCIWILHLWMYLPGGFYCNVSHTHTAIPIIIEGHETAFNGFSYQFTTGKPLKDLKLTLEYYGNGSTCICIWILHLWMYLPGDCFLCYVWAVYFSNMYVCMHVFWIHACTDQVSFPVFSLMF
jgi:hypothetical protein